MRFAAATDDQRLSATAVLAGTGRTADISAFEAAVVAAVDGVRDNAAVARAVGVDVNDLRIALAALLAKGLLSEPAVRPALRLVPVTQTSAAPGIKLPRTSTPSPLSSGQAVPWPAGRDDRHGAATLQARSLRALRKGDVDDARAIAEQAAALAPGIDSHREVLSAWEEHVGRHLGAELHGKARVAVVRAHLDRHPKSAPVWMLLAVVLANDDPRDGGRSDVRDLEGAIAAAGRADDLSTSSERKQQARALASTAGREARRDKIRNLFGGGPTKPAKRR